MLGLFIKNAIFTCLFCGSQLSNATYEKTMQNLQFIFFGKLISNS